MRADGGDTSNCARKASLVVRTVTQRSGGRGGPAGQKRRWAQAPQRAVGIAPAPRSRMGRLVWSWIRHPVRSREYPAERERLITAEDRGVFEE